MQVLRCSLNRTADIMANIPEYYAGKNVLVTGATGFMGKVKKWLIEQTQKCELHNKLRGSLQVDSCHSTWQNGEANK